MRLEINIADERPEAKILSTINDPAAYMLELVLREGPKPEPDYAGAIAMIRQSPNLFKSREEVDAYINELRNEW